MIEEIRKAFQAILDYIKSISDSQGVYVREDYWEEAMQ